MGRVIRGLAFCAGVLCTATHLTPVASAQTNAVGATQNPGTEIVAETRASFRDWRVMCRPQGFCIAETTPFVGHVRADPKADFVLRVGSFPRGLDYRLSFTAVAAEADVDSDITVLVDGEWVATLSADDDLGWHLEPDLGPNAYVFSQSVANLEILPALIDGARAIVAFRDWQGKRRKVPFSLIGLTAALEWIDRERLSLDGGSSPPSD